MSENASGKGKKIVLWIISIVIMLSAFSYQKRTGPTYPYRGSYKIGDQEYHHKLIRSGDSHEDAIVELKIGEYSPSLFYKRFKTEDDFTQVLMEKKQENFTAYLPKQPAAGKLEYYIVIKDGDKKIRIPQNKEENIVIRFKDSVPSFILIPHILLMFFAMLVGMRAALGALFAPDSMRPFVWFSFVSMTIGGMVLGPIVQKYAFGEYWTGFPWGGDWTDNKMLIMWVAWLTAISIVGLKAKSKELMSRIVVILAAIVMTGVYVIPHSIHGSELDYSKVDAGIDPAEAIKTGKQMNAVHWHLVVVHVPVIGLFFTFALLVCAHATKQEILYKISYSFAICCAIFAIFAYISGPLAYEAQVDLDKKYVDPHAILGKISFMAMIILGVIALSAIAQYAQQEKPSRLHRYVILFMVAVLIYLLCWTANTGGAIRHIPIRGENIIFPSLGN